MPSGENPLRVLQRLQPLRAEEVHGTLVRKLQQTATLLRRKGDTATAQGTACASILDRPSYMQGAGWTVGSPHDPCLKRGKEDGPMDPEGYL